MSALHNRTYKEKRAEREAIIERANSYVNFLQKSLSSNKVKERFYRKPYGKYDEMIDDCKGCFGASNDDCQRCPHDEEIKDE